jgi:hypothetical protein
MPRVRARDARDLVAAITLLEGELYVITNFEAWRQAARRRLEGHGHAGPIE